MSRESKAMLSVPLVLQSTDLPGVSTSEPSLLVLARGWATFWISTLPGGGVGFIAQKGDCLQMLHVLYFTTQLALNALLDTVES